MKVGDKFRLHPDGPVFTVTRRFDAFGPPTVRFIHDSLPAWIHESLCIPVEGDAHVG